MIIDLVQATQNGESAEIVASIDDLLIEILLRLPIKSLIRFKIVSKHWHSLVINPNFIGLRNPHPNPAVGLFLPDYWNDPFYDYVPLVPKVCSISPLRKLNSTEYWFNVKVLHSCNGLLLCSGFNSCKSSDKCYFVCNPTTNQVSTLPKLDGIVCGMSLAFDPVKSLNPYKVICVCYYRYHRIAIYSPETGAWRTSSALIPSTACVDFKDGVYWNGAVHWLQLCKSGDSLYFNVHDQMLKKMPTLLMATWCRPHYFVESCDYLHYFEICRQKDLVVYEMKRDYSEWFVKYHVDLSVVASAHPEMIEYIRDISNGWCYYVFFLCSIVRVGEKEDDDSFLTILWIPGKAIRYNLVSKTFQELRVLPVLEYPYKRRWGEPKGFHYIESLSCV